MKPRNNLGFFFNQHISTCTHMLVDIYLYKHRQYNFYDNQSLFDNLSMKAIRKFHYHQGPSVSHGF